MKGTEPNEAESLSPKAINAPSGSDAIGTDVRGVLRHASNFLSRSFAPVIALSVSTLAITHHRQADLELLGLRR
jgi:hypothetical protein